ncbi:TolC family protein [Thiorhodococcus mannitoliphagus]|uniref:TolC family protein n=1 Tax=Thiorhodococcus mannitoliphagus TaxID=329406 RepID=A0A6P1E4G7_9GAMM|nr:TolC family protein [Thiorhodococcus mannitoliphagus]NEX22555.1 TolC family protein [Thiorhodococcus mannitoliphagus]
MDKKIAFQPHLASRRRPPASLLALLVLATGGVQAGSLGGAISSALEQAAQQPRVGAIRAERDAVRRQAESLIAEDPALRVKHISDRIDQDQGAYEWEAMVDLPLWMPGQRDARQGVATAIGGQADTLTRLLRWEMAGRVREALWNTALAQGRLTQAEQALASARALEATVAKRVKAGELARVDLLVARQDALDREAELQAAQVEHARTLAIYRQLTGESELPEPLFESAPKPEATTELPAEHPLLSDADSALALARAERARAQSERRGNPVLSLGGIRTRDARGTDAQHAVQMEINLPFGLASQSAPKIAAAERSYTERMADFQQTRRQAEQRLTEARVNRSGAAEALTVAERRHSLAHEALDLVRRAFDLGETDLTTRLRAEERARQASMDLELRRLEQGRALAEINQALGVVPE